jgi:hypothetical protein
MERVLDAFLSAALRPSLRLFSTASPFDDEGAAEDSAGAGPVLPVPPRVGCEAQHNAALFAYGAALAQAALQGCSELAALGRLPELAFEAIARGPGAALISLSTLPAALQALGSFDAGKARAMRSCLQDAAADFDLEALGWTGLDVAVTDANKSDVLRRQCERVLVRDRFSAWEQLHAGFLAGGGATVLQAMQAEQLHSLRPLVYDPWKTERRRAAQAQGLSSDEAFIAARTRTCPNARCRAALTKDEACMHVRCSACGTAFNWCCLRVELGHPPFSCPYGGDISVRLRLT